MFCTGAKPDIPPWLISHQTNRADFPSPPSARVHRTDYVDGVEEGGEGGLRASDKRRRQRQCVCVVCYVSVCVYAYGPVYNLFVHCLRKALSHTRSRHRRHRITLLPVVTAKLHRTWLHGSPHTQTHTHT